eukprot:COSAG06_NODE_196_length_20472_cov_49.724207_22_plen_71_part_00
MARDAANRFLFTRDMRHSAVLVRGGELLVFWTRVGDCPELILLSRCGKRLFGAIFLFNNDPSAKTGSGQT